MGEATKIERRRPWVVTPELLGQEGVWSDLVAFERWFSVQQGRLDPDGDLMGALDDGPSYGQDRITLYQICCALADGARAKGSVSDG